MARVREVSPEGPAWVKAWTPAEGRDRAASLLRQELGVDATCHWSAAGRATLVGEHTDYNAGLSLATVTPHRAYVAAAPREDDVVRVTSGLGDVLEGPGRVWEGRVGEAPGPDLGWPAYPAGIVWAMHERGFSGRGMDLAIESCLPPQGGLASSAAVLGATALAVNDLWRLALDGDDGRSELADACVDAENAMAGVMCGPLDPHVVLRCGADEALLLDFSGRSVSATHYPMYIRDYGLGLLVVDTQVPHGDVRPWFESRRAECAAAAHALGAADLREIADSPQALRRVESLEDPIARRRARHVVSEIERVRLVAAELGGTAPAHERFVSIGKAIFRSHASLDVDYEASRPSLDLAVDAAFRAGALGARVSGAGGGGSVIALVRKAQAESTATQIADAFTAEGRLAPRFLWI